jgi:hypothetical protein
MMTSAIAPMADAPLFGHGAGAGSNIGSYLIHNGETLNWSLGEYEWPRIIEELGAIVGSWFLAFRVGLCTWLLAISIRASRKLGDEGALVLFGFSGPLLLTGTITGQNQILSFCWLFVGLTIALARPASFTNRRSRRRGQI